MKSDKILIFYSFFVSLLLTVVGVLSAKDTSQMINGLVFLPLVFYFGTNLLHLGANQIRVIKTKPKPIPVKPVELTPEIVPGVADNNKRLFLKLIGSSGVILLLMALFTKRAQASFFGSAPTGPGAVFVKDTAGNKINPAEKSPTDGYAITNIDDASTPAYYGFVKKTGDWYIMNQSADGVYLYAKGTVDFSTNWDNRSGLGYDYFNVVFG
jgi:hypothetical protein